MGHLVYFIRHGQTDWNAESRIQGHIDIPINARGREQARRNGGILRELIAEPQSFDFLSSPLMRTRQTMEIIRSEIGLDPTGYRTDDRLMEISFGTWNGEKIADMVDKDPDGYAARSANVWDWSPPQGESYRELSQRVKSAFDEIDRDTVIVSHGGVMRCIRGHVLNLDPQEIVHLDVPQDKVLMIENRSLSWL